MRRFLLTAFLLASLAGFSNDAQAAGHIYLLKGLANVFSAGMDTLAEKLTKLGYNATVYGYGEADTLALEAAKLQKSGKGPIIIIGHSFGADAAITMAEKMKDEGARVALIVTFGSTMHQDVPSNVTQVVNYYQTSTPLHATYSRGEGFHGVISNVNLDKFSEINHLNIEKNDRLHSQVIARIQAIAHASHSSTTSSD